MLAAHFFDTIDRDAATNLATAAKTTQAKTGFTLYAAGKAAPAPPLQPPPPTRRRHLTITFCAAPLRQYLRDL